MRILLLLLSLLVPVASLASETPLHRESPRVPSHACHSFQGTCTVTIAFTIQADGSVSDISIEESSRSRPCDRATMLAVAKWRYKPREAPVRLVEQVKSYSCPLPDAANNSFKPTPLRGAA